MKKYKSQKRLVLEYLLQGKSITQRKAFAFWNIIRLSAIIYSLKRDGFIFETHFKENYTGKGRYAEYKLVIPKELDFYDFK